MGRTDPTHVLRHVSIHFKPSARQQSDLNKLLADQQNRASPHYREWLSPEQYADRFGPSSNDFARVMAWLRDSGFQMNSTAAARNWIAVDGSVETVERAFHTEIHDYLVDGETRFANSAEPVVPAEIEPLVGGVTGLSNFHMTAPSQVPPSRKQSPEYSSPDYTKAPGAHLLAPDDIAAIYDIAALYASGYDGTGQTLVVIGESDISLGDIAAFRTVFGLPAIRLQQILVPGTPDPGHVATPEAEADRDLEWAGAIARNAMIVYVYAQSSVTALEYALSPPAGSSPPGGVVSTSFGSCEAQASSFLPILLNLVNQANAEGITILAASGDSGPAGCDRTNAASAAMGGVSVLVPAAVPGVTAVGGTEFNEGTATYWNPVDSPTYESALSYIPEVAWNDSASLDVLAASGGGISSYFPKPGWQNVPGVPAGNLRSIPDVALAASEVHDAYVMFSSAKADCSLSSGGCVTGGTSAATAVFAGIVTILNQYVAADGNPSGFGFGLGNINPALYDLFTAAPNAFHDVVAGNNVVKCAIGTTGCPGAGSYGYSAGPGYDPVTGLGSVDAFNMVTQWPGNAGALAPAIKPNGVVPLYNSTITIQPGEWGSIYGSNLASGDAVWSGNFPTSLADTSVFIDGKLAYLWSVSPGQINFQAPDDLKTGPVPVVVTTINGSTNSTVNLGAVGPSFCLLDQAHVTGIILRADGSGAYGNGAFDILGPTGNSLGYQTVAATAGDAIELFGVGMGPTKPAVPAGKAFSGAAPLTAPLLLFVNQINVTPSFAGLAEAGVYQINLTVPAGLGTGDVPLLAITNAMQTQSFVVIALQ
jgi:uncharacterized protein (TIGR03437 family)